jgi:hypothetical protein
VSSTDDSLPPTGMRLRQAFEALVETFHAHRVHYVIIGGVAVIQHTRIRTTVDIDALVSLPQTGMPGFFEALQARGFTVDVMRSIRELRDEGMTAIRFQDVVVDLMRPLLPAYAHVLDRSIEATVFGHSVKISSAEGLILMKVIAMRPQDELDVRDLLATYAGSLDIDFIRKELDAISEPDDPRRAKLESWVAEVRGTGGDLKPGL